jgi:hypothetical protein
MVMNIQEFLSALKARGVSLWSENGHIHFQSMKGQLLESEFETIRSLKTSILQMLDETQVPEDIPLKPRAGGISRVKLTATQSMPWNYSQTIGPRVGTIMVALRLSGAPDIELLRDCLIQLQLRHESLRTSIEVCNGILVQKIEPVAISTFPVQSLSKRASEKSDRLIQRQILDFAERRISNPEGAVFDGMIIKVAKYYHLLICVDHIVTDRWSIRVMFDDLWRMYAAGSHGGRTDLPLLTVQFPDYAAWLWRIFPTWRMRNASYWAKHLSDAQSPFWKSRPRASKVSSKYSSITFVLGGETTERLYSVCKSLRSFPAIAVIAAFSATMLHRNSQKELTLIVVDSGRYRPELFSMVGCLAEHLYLRIEMRSDMAFDDLLLEVLREYNSASEHRSFDWLPLVVERSDADLYFNYMSADAEKSFLPPPEISPSLRVEPFPVRVTPERQSAAISAALPFKLGLAAYGSENSLSFQLAYDRQMIGMNAIKAIRDDLLRLLRGAAENPRSHIGGLFLGERALSPVLSGRT